MKKILVFAVMAALIFCLSVNSFAAEEGFLKYTYVKDGNTYFLPFKTSQCTPEQLDFMKRWAASDSNLVTYHDNTINFSIVPKSADIFIFTSSNVSRLAASQRVETLQFRVKLIQNADGKWIPTYFEPKYLYNNAGIRQSGYLGEKIGENYYTNHFHYIFDGGVSIHYGKGVISGTYLNHKPLSGFTKNFSNFNYQGQLVLQDDSGIFDEFVPLPKERTLTINYQYSNGSQAAFPFTKQIQAGQSYNITAPKIEGYTADKPIISGTMPDNDLAVTVTYTPNNYDLTVHYQYEDGSKALDSVVRSIGYNQPYHIPTPNITGYTPDLSSVVGTMPSKPVIVTVTYTKDADPDPPLPPDPEQPEPPIPSEPERPDIPGADFDSEYVVFSANDVVEMGVTLWHNLGSISSVALYTFLLVFAIYVVIQIVDYLGR